MHAIFLPRVFFPDTQSVIGNGHICTWPTYICQGMLGDVKVCLDKVCSVHSW